MLRWYCMILADLAVKRRSSAYKLAFLVAGSCVFLGVLPYWFFSAAQHLPAGLRVSFPRMGELVLGPIAIVAGLALVYWTVKTQWNVGYGTPSIIAPTRRLIVTGPYARCRNPLQFGALFYFFGVGTLAGSLTHGLCCAILGLLAGCTYQKFVEEKEMLLRFGGEYSAYRARTPFLLPRLRAARKPGNPRPVHRDKREPVALGR